MSNIYLIGSVGSGKTIYIKKKIFNNLREGRPSIYINFNKGSQEFSKVTLNDALIINSNSFTQISKIKNKEYNSLIVFNFSNQRNNLSQMIKEKVLLEILNHPKWSFHDIFIDDASQVANHSFFRNINHSGKIFISIQGMKEDMHSHFKNIVYFSHRAVSLNLPRHVRQHIKRGVEGVIKYVESFDNRHEYKQIDLRDYTLLDSKLSYSERMDILLDK